MRVIDKIGRPRSGSPIRYSRVWLQTELEKKKSYNQLIIAISISEKTNIPRKKMTPVETIASTVWLQVSDYSQMSHYIIRLQLYRIISGKKKKKKAANAPIIFE